MKKSQVRKLQKELKDLDAIIRSAKKGVERAEKAGGTGSEKHTLAILAFVEVATNVSKRSYEIQQIFNKSEGATKR